MTLRDPGSFSNGSGLGVTMAAPLVTSTEVGPNLFHEFRHRPAAVVARDVGMQVLPDALDAIVIGAVRGQELEHHAVLYGGHCQLHLEAAVDAVVVEDHVDLAFGPVGSGALTHGFSYRNCLVASPES